MRDKRRMSPEERMRDSFRTGRLKCGKSLGRKGRLLNAFRCRRIWCGQADQEQIAIYDECGFVDIEQVWLFGERANLEARRTAPRPWLPTGQRPEGPRDWEIVAESERHHDA